MNFVIRAGESAIAGAIVYMVLGYILDQVITGTSTADNLFTLILPIVFAAAVTIGVFRQASGGSQNQ